MFSRALQLSFRASPHLFFSYLFNLVCQKSQTTYFQVAQLCTYLYFQILTDISYKNIFPFFLIKFVTAFVSYFPQYSITASLSHLCFTVPSLTGAFCVQLLHICSFWPAAEVFNHLQIKSLLI